jgi:hypothetical protein
VPLKLGRVGTPEKFLPAFKADEADLPVNGMWRNEILEGFSNNHQSLGD